MNKLSRILGFARKTHDSTDSTSTVDRSDSGPREVSDWRTFVGTVMEDLRPGDQGFEPAATASAAVASAGTVATDAALTTQDRRAIARYDFLLQTASPREIEEIHKQAFAQLTSEQRDLVRQRMQHEFAAVDQPASSGPADLAAAVARAESHCPGTLEGLLSRAREEDSDQGDGPLEGTKREGSGGATAAASAVAAGGASGLLGLVAAGAIASMVGVVLLTQAMQDGVNFEALADGISMESLSDGFGIDLDVADAQGLVNGFGDTVTGLGDPGSVLGFGPSDWNTGISLEDMTG
jgi:hypothetical protein